MENIELIDFIKSQFAEIGILAAAVVLIAQGLKSLFNLKDRVLFTAFGHSVTVMYIVALVLSAIAGFAGMKFGWGIYEGSNLWSAIIISAQVWIGATFGYDHLRDWLRKGKSKLQ